MTGRQRGVMLQDFELDPAQRRQLGDFGLRQACLSLERVGAKRKARSPRDDTHCALQLFIQTHDECSQRAVQIANESPDDDEQRDRDEPDRSGDESGDDAAVAGEVEPGESLRQELIAWHEEAAIQPQNDIDQCALQVGAHHW